MRHVVQIGDSQSIDHVPTSIALLHEVHVYIYQPIPGSVKFNKLSVVHQSEKLTFYRTPRLDLNKVQTVPKMSFEHRPPILWQKC